MIMYKLNQLFTSGTWLVKQGKEEEFVREWKEFADWSVQNNLGSDKPYLLEDINNPKYYISFGPWPDKVIVAHQE